MRILFLLLNLPDLEKDNNLYGDLALEFADHGHQVFVATLLEARNRKKTYETEQKGIRILHVRSADLFNVGFIKKGLSMIALQRRFQKAIKTHWEGLGFELVIYPTPPISFLGVIKWLRREYHCWTYLILRDIFPQNAVDVGILRRGLIYRYFRNMEKELYAVSDRIGCMSPGNVEYVLLHNALRGEKVGLLPNWRRIRDLSPFARRDFRSELGLGQRIVAVFGGVIGIAQELDFLLELAKLYRDSDHVRFLIIGDGNRYQSLAEIIRRESLSNVILRNKIPSNEFAALVKHCDIGLINLNRRFTIPNFPSKVLDYFEASLPVLAATDSSTDFGQLLEESGAGFHCLTGDLGAYRDCFEKLVADPQLRSRMGLRGRRYLEAHLTVDLAYRTIDEALR
jgi:glycosyltransferase involved in cell wall biosynthesis